MKCWEDNSSTLSKTDRINAHQVNMRFFNTCPVCDDLKEKFETFNPLNGRPEDYPLDDIARANRNFEFKKPWWKFW